MQYISYYIGMNETTNKGDKMEYTMTFEESEKVFQFTIVDGWSLEKAKRAFEITGDEISSAVERVSAKRNNRKARW